MTPKRLLILIPVVVIVLNGVGYLIFSKLRAPSEPVATTAPSAPETAAGSAAPGALPATGAPAPTPAPAAVSEEQRKEETAMARRAAGLAALEAGDYDKALINFTEARALIGEKARVADLLRVTEDLRRPHPAPAPPPTPARTRGGGSSSSSSRAAARSSGGRRAAAREREEPADEPSSPAPAAAPASGLIIVTTTPRGLLVHVDDTPVDLTPMRTKVKAGYHRVALYDGDRKLYETTLDVKEGSAATLLKDLSGEEGGGATAAGAPAAAAPPPPPSPQPAPVARTEAARAVTAPPSEAAAPAIAAQPPGFAGGGTGALEITSPGLYGVVWINGRPRGYPPLEVHDLPPGPAKIEVRVNGIEKRTSTVLVRAGLTTAVKLR